MDAREYPSELRLIFERLQVASEWQTEQSRRMGEVHTELRAIALQTAERRGSTTMRRAIVAGAVVAIGVVVSMIGLALNALGVF